MNRIRRNPKPMSLENLILEIESLEEDGIIPFEDFKNIPPYIIKGDYFPMVHPTLIVKALIKIEDIRKGKKTSTFSIEKTEFNGEKIKITRKTESF